MDYAIAMRWADKCEGNPPQAHGALTKVVGGEEADCCLGILAKIGMEEGLVTRALRDPDVRDVDPSYVYTDNDPDADGSAGVLPVGLRDWAGMYGVEGLFNHGLRVPHLDDGRIVELMCLAELNDRAKWDLPTIGRFIRKNWRNL